LETGVGGKKTPPRWAKAGSKGNEWGKEEKADIGLREKRKKGRRLIGKRGIPKRAMHSG